MFSKLFSKNKEVDTAIQLPKDRFGFMSQNEQLQFQDEITRHFQDKPDFNIDFFNGVVIRKDGLRCGLDNLAQMYHQFSPKEREKLVADHFNTLLKTEQEEKEIFQDISNYQTMKKYLAVRLYPLDYLTSTGEDGLFYKEDLKGILTVLVLDLPSTVLILKPEDAEKWKISKEDLFEVGFRNTFTNNKVEITQEKFVENAVLWTIGSETNLFASAYIYEISKYPKMIGKYGSIISIPHRHIVLVHPINNMSTVKALNQMMIISDGLFKEGPGSISKNIYWYNKGKFTNLPYILDDDEFKFMPPQSFVEVLNQLAKGR